MTGPSSRSPFTNVVLPHVGNPLRTTPSAPSMLEQEKYEPLLTPMVKRKGDRSTGPFASVSGFSDGLGYTVEDRMRGIPDRDAKHAADKEAEKLTRLHDMAKLTTLYDKVDGELKQQAEASLDLSAFDAAGVEIAERALDNPMLDGPMKRKLTPMVQQMVALHREGLRQRVLDSHRKEADDIVSKAIQSRDAEAMTLAAQVGRSKPATAERESLLRALVDKAKFIEEMRGTRVGLEDAERARQAQVFQERLVFAQHSAGLRHAHETGGEAGAQAYLDGLTEDRSIPDALRPILVRRLGIDLAQLEDLRLAKEVKAMRRQAYEALSEIHQIRTGDPLPTFEDDQRADAHEAALEIWRPFDRWDRSPSDIPEAVYRILEQRFADGRSLRTQERATLQAQFDRWHADPEAALKALESGQSPLNIRGIGTRRKRDLQGREKSDGLMGRADTDALSPNAPSGAESQDILNP